MEKYTNIEDAEAEVSILAKLISQRDATQHQISSVQIILDAGTVFYYPEHISSLDIDCTEIIEEFRKKIIALLDDRIALGMQKIDGVKLIAHNS